MPRRVLIATYEELPELDVDGPALIAALRAEGIDAEPVVWTRCSRPSEPVLIRSTWDYPQQPTDFVAWVRSLRAVINSSAMIEWNVDKRYLAELRDRGVPVVPTWFLVPDTGPTLAELVAGELASTYPGSEIVVKPAIGASSCDTIRVDPRNDDDMASAGRLVESIHRSGRAVLVQPYLARIDSDGEVSLVYFDGDYSHAVLRQPVLVPERGEVHPGVEETRLIDATPAMLEIATNTLDVVTDLVHRPVNARIDLLPGDTGHLLGEIELIEPSLFLHAPGAPARFARAISQALSSPDLTGFAPYVPRVTTALGPRTVVAHGAEMGLKVYTIHLPGHPVPTRQADAALELLAVEAPWTAADHHGLGFVFVHHGRDATWVGCCWWTEHEILDQRLYRLRAGGLQPVTEPHVGCVWELAIHAHERGAWIDAMLTPRPDPAGYLSNSLDEG